MQKFWIKKVDPDVKVLKNRLFWLLQSAPLSTNNFNARVSKMVNRLTENRLKSSTAGF